MPTALALLWNVVLWIPSARGHRRRFLTPAPYLAMSSSSTVAASFIHAHPSILQYLECRRVGPENSDNPSLKNKVPPVVWVDVNQRILAFREPLQAPVSCAELVTLAIQCDEALYPTTASSSFFGLGSSSSSWSSPLESLRQLGEINDWAVNAATAVVSFNRLESAIRQRTGYQTGQAPLLKTMMQDLQVKLNDQETTNLSFILQGLLLPTGLNLRNLLWHGFAGGLPRPWLSLSLCLIHQLEAHVTVHHQHTTTTTIHTHDTFAKVDSFSQSSSSTPMPAVDDAIILQWLPQSHRDLWRCAYAWKTEYPTWSLVLLCMLLEHGLRLQWCHIHHRPMDAMAQPQQFYVTLDGFGQRLVHDILLHPYLQRDGDRNQLVEQCLDASTTALLSDLFCAPLGPNLRASLAHGVFDTQLQEEGIRMAQQVASSGGGSQPSVPVHLTSKDPNQPTTHNPMDPCVTTVLVALQTVAYSCQGQQGQSSLSLRQTLTYLYKPQYSYAASTRRNLQRCLAMLDELSKRSDDVSQNGIPSYVQRLAIVKHEDLVQMFSQRLDHLSFSKGTGSTVDWSVTQLYQEYDLNQQLAPLGAVQRLIQDIAHALAELNNELDVAQSSLNNSQHRNLSTRQRRRYHRVLTTCASAGATFYSFTAYIVLLALQDALDKNQWDPAERLNIVERTRMVLSTVSTYLTSNTDRAYKAMEDYTKGKVLKKLILDAQHRTSP